MKKIFIAKFSNQETAASLRGVKELLVESIGSEYHVLVIGSQFVTEPVFEIVYDPSLTSSSISSKDLMTSLSKEKHGS